MEKEERTNGYLIVERHFMGGVVEDLDDTSFKYCKDKVELHNVFLNYYYDNYLEGVYDGTIEKNEELEDLDIESLSEEEKEKIYTILLKEIEEDIDDDGVLHNGIYIVDL